MDKMKDYAKLYEKLKSYCIMNDCAANTSILSHKRRLRHFIQKLESE